MKQGTLALLGLATLITTAACSHKTPVAASHPADVAPVAAAPAAPAPAPQRSAPAQTARTETPSTPQRPSQMTAQERATLNERLARLEDALFDYDKATIRTDATTALRDDVGVIRDILANYPSQKLLIEGHADERGSEEYNLALGDKRAQAAEEFLVTMGIPNAQLTIVSFGKDRPVCTEKTEDCWQRNRRAHVTAAP
ncbi:MAG: OmpA family protein [Bryobacteraceae bacterium]